MTPPRVLECAIPMERPTKKRYGPRSDRFGGPVPSPAGRVPRLARLLALAHKLDGLVRQGAIADYAALARLGHVSRPRISQIMSLLYLAPAIQEEILFLPRTVQGRDLIHLRQLQPIAQALDWRRQRALWRQLTAKSYSRLPAKFPGGSCLAEVTDWGRAQPTRRGRASIAAQMVENSSGMTKPAISCHLSRNS